MIEQLLALEVDLTEPSDEEVHRVGLSHSEEFSSSPLAEVNHILLGVAPDDLKGREDKRRGPVLIDRLQLEPITGTPGSEVFRLSLAGNGGSLDRLHADKPFLNLKK